MTWRNLLQQSPLIGRAFEARARRANLVPEVRGGEEGWFEPSGLPSRPLQQLWFATLRTEWRSLVVVPAHAGASAFPVARALAAVGTVHTGETVELVEGGAISLEESRGIVEQMRAKLAGGGRAVVAIDPLVSSLSGLPVALAADAVLVCVTLGVADLASARRTIELLGEGRILGAVALRPEALR